MIVGNYISNESNDCKIKSPLEFLSKRGPNKEYHQFLINYYFSNGDTKEVPKTYQCSDFEDETSCEVHKPFLNVTQ